VRIGYFLSSEEYDPHQLVEQAKLAEEAGFEALWISDHYHPWNDAQGQSPFVWGVIGAVSQVCRLPVTTAVTAPTLRIHPAVIAQAAATATVQLEGRFALGVGTGEALNEHIFGDAWPSEQVRLEMLEEAVTVIRELWQGDYTYHYGRHYTVENARIYTRPEKPPPIYLSAFGDKSFDLALRVGDGFITTQPDAGRVARWKSKAGPEKPTQAGYKVCVADAKDEGVEIAHRLWSTAGLPGELSQVLPSPKHFEQAVELVTPDMTRESTACGKDVDEHVQAFAPYAEAGFDEIYIANMGPHYRDFFQLYAEEVLPRIRQRSGHSPVAGSS
jgi:G6PDH family F420-dependent oxidoreductase